MRLWPWSRRGRALSPDAMAAVEEANRLRGWQESQAKQWKGHLESNGFAELVADALRRPDRP